MKTKRVITDVLIFIGILILPWWLSAIILAVTAFYLPFFLEIIFFGFVFDALYGTDYTGLIVSTLFLIVVMFAKSRIRM